MDDSGALQLPVAGPARRIARRLLAIGENRLNLLVTEIEEERDHVLDVIIVSGAIVALGMIAGLSFIAALVIALWQNHPVLVLCLIGVACGLAAVLLGLRLNAVRRRQNALSATLEQLRKDREMFVNSDPGMKTIESRKQLLVAESDINRALLLRDYDELTEDLHSITGHFKKLARMASIASMAMSVFKFFKR